MLQTAVILPGYGYVGTVMDITGQKQAEEMLKLHRDDLEKRVAERTAALQEQVEMLERFSDVAVLRELRMMALEKELEAMKAGKQNGKG